MSAELGEAAAKALETFQRVSDPTNAGGVGLGSVPMPNSDAGGLKHHVTKDALTFSKGVVFFTQVKAGAIVSAQTATGFVMRKLNGPPGEPSTWSAPLFFSDTHIGIGASVGVEMIDAMLLLLDEAGLEQFATGGLNAKSNFKVHADLSKVTAKGNQPVRNELDRGSVNAIPFYVQSGVMLDWSTSSGYMRVSKGRNEAAYGKGVEYSDVLSGSVPKPDEFKPLYSALAAVMNA